MVERRFSRQDLVEQSQTMGLAAGGRFIDEWVRQGLLSPPSAPGRGRNVGGRAKGTWSPEQFEIFKSVVATRVAGAPIPVLCNIPVSEWVMRGDIAIPLRQVRRAMATWAGSGQKSNWRAAKETARAVVAELQHPHARPADTERLAEVIALAAFRGRLDEGSLLAAQEVFDPEGEGRWRGASGMELTATDYVRWARSQLEIRRLLAGKDQEVAIPDERYWSARLALGAGIVLYARTQPLAAQVPENAPYFPPLSEFEVTFTACLALSMMLSHALTAVREPLPGFERLVKQGESMLGGFEDTEDFIQGKETAEQV